jgi:hypothetical protein
MAKQTFTTGQVLTAAQMTSLQQTAMGGGAATAKTASYVLVAADAGTVIQMNAAGATTITVNTALFAAGDTVQIQNIGAGVCTVTAGTATVTTAGSLALSQWEGGQLYFSSTSASIFFDTVQASGGGGKVLQVVQGTTTTPSVNATTTFQSTNITATITPTLSTSKILVLSAVMGIRKGAVNSQLATGLRLVRDSTVIVSKISTYFGYTDSTLVQVGALSHNYLDSPATTSATTYRLDIKCLVAAADVQCQYDNETSTIILMEIGA